MDDEDHWNDLLLLGVFIEEEKGGLVFPPDKILRPLVCLRLLDDVEDEDIRGALWRRYYELVGVLKEKEHNDAHRV